MLRNIAQTGALIKNDGLFVGIEDINDPDFDNTGVNAKAFGKGRKPEICFSCPPDNKYPVFLQEHASSPPTARVWLHPGGAMTFDRSTVQAMNIIYSIGSP